MYSAMAAGAIPLATYSNVSDFGIEETKELYELRAYEVKFGGNQQLLKDYLKTILGPALLRIGARKFMLFGEMGNSDPTKLWYMIAYPNAATFLKAQDLNSDAVYVNAASEYNAHHAGPNIVY